MAKASATSAGPSIRKSTRRSVPSHFPTTIARVESAVAASRSRLPRSRSSDIDMGATADNIRSPKTTCRMHPIIPATGAVDRTIMSTPCLQTLTAPTKHAIPVEPPISTIRVNSQREGRERCHSRQNTGLRSSEGPGSHRNNRARTRKAGSFRSSTFPRRATGRIRHTARRINSAAAASVIAKKPA